MAKIIIIGAGIGGLSAAMALAHAGHDVDVFERAASVGGKMRQLPSIAGPVDAGPTVLTMRHVFDQAFEAAGTRLSDHVTLHQAPVIARHFWSDGSVLDFSRSLSETITAVSDWGGGRAREDFVAFQKDIALLYQSFDQAMMYSTTPSLAAVAGITFRNAKLRGLLSRNDTLERYLRRRFKDPRLAQLFGRYATYVGGAPDAVPMVLSLIAKSEGNGVWTVEGGMHALAQAMADQATSRGARIHLNEGVTDISNSMDVTTASGTKLSADAVLFNGDPAALHRGLLGPSVTPAVKTAAVAPRALSAQVWAFGAEASDIDLSHHNVFFADTPNSEFRDIAAGRTPHDPTLYVCAEDRATGVPTGAERFEIIMNAAAVGSRPPTPEENKTCASICFQRLSDFGLTFSPTPGENSQTGPAEFAKLFAGSDGSLYGRSPSGMMAPFQRPTVRSRIKGLYLCGGGVHPGAGIPMASLSGQHAAAAILSDLTSTSRSRQTVTHGGISTA